MFNQMHFWNELVMNVFNDLGGIIYDICWIFIKMHFMNVCMLWIYDVYIQYVVLVSKWYLIISNVQYLIISNDF